MEKCLKFDESKFNRTAFKYDAESNNIGAEAGSGAEDENIQCATQ